jgi:Zn-finger nucleic acid-binding protein/DNA-directed RNA polymerase subunit RPC12/RpoP
MKLLVACTQCKRQYDASGMEVGSVFRCACGARIVVPFPKSHDAAVVKCSWCGAPRTEGAEKCAFCESEFTLHEKDLDTICPVCMARVSNKARFCHHCATPIVPEGKPGEATLSSCPVCGGEKKLQSRRLGQLSVAVMECQGCGGLWLGIDAFEAVLERARDSALPPKTLGGTTAPVRNLLRGSQAPQTGPLYRPCAVCGTLMNRKNYGRTSGVIIDVCSEHGVWFDADELERLIAWIRSGGLAISQELKQEEEKAARQEAAKKLVRTPVEEWGENLPRRSTFLDFVVDLIASIFFPTIL